MKTRFSPSLMAMVAVIGLAAARPAGAQTIREGTMGSSRSAFSGRGSSSSSNSGSSNTNTNNSNNSNNNNRSGNNNSNARATPAAAAKGASPNMAVPVRPPGQPVAAPGQPQQLGQGGAAAKGKASGANTFTLIGKMPPVSKGLAESVRPVKVDYDSQKLSENPSFTILNPRKYVRETEDAPKSGGRDESSVAQPL